MKMIEADLYETLYRSLKTDYENKKFTKQEMGLELLSLVTQGKITGEPGEVTGMFGCFLLGNSSPDYLLEHLDKVSEKCTWDNSEWIGKILSAIRAESQEKQNVHILDLLAVVKLFVIKDDLALFARSL